MKALIVDDEKKSRNVLHYLCEQYCPDLKIVGHADSVENAETWIVKTQPDLIFLDIRMPNKNGFQLLEKYMPRLPFQVIFTTAYDQYALQAFQYAAIDYLLKPVNIDELVAAVQKVSVSGESLFTPKKWQLFQQYLQKNNIQKISLSTADGIFFYQLKDIIRCEAEGNYSRICLINNQSLLITKTLKYFEELLTDKSFFRIHKSHLINLYHVRQYLKRKQHWVAMTDGKRIEVSLRKKKDLLQLLDQLI